WPSSVSMHSPLLGSQILTVPSPARDATGPESWEKATDLTSPLWPSSVWRHSPLLASQILTVRSPDADASRAESWEKATDLTSPLWPSSVWRQALHLSPIAGFIVIHFGASSLKRPRIMLRAGLNRSADAYA